MVLLFRMLFLLLSLWVVCWQWFTIGVLGCCLWCLGLPIAGCGGFNDDSIDLVVMIYSLPVLCVGCYCGLFAVGLFVCWLVGGFGCIGLLALVNLFV